jgi:hypothetical protein
MSYSTKSKVTREVCERLGYTFEIRWVKAMRRNGKTYVSGTAGKPEEWRKLWQDCERVGYIYKGREVV